MKDIYAAKLVVSVASDNVTDEQCDSALDSDVIAEALENCRKQIESAVQLVIPGAMVAVDNETGV